MAWQDVKKKIKQQFSDVLEIPRDVMLNLPKIVLIGNLQLFLENHNGITEYTPQLVRIAVAEGTVEIAGEGLQLRNILPEELCIEGQIKSIEFYK